MSSNNGVRSSELVTHESFSETVWAKIRGPLSRLLFAVLVILSIIFLGFFGLDMSRGATLTSAVTAGLRATGSYVIGLAGGDLGRSTSIRGGGITVPVAEVLPTILLRSLGLIGVSLLFALTVGSILGTLSARRNRSNAHLLPFTLSLIGISLPSFFVALLLQVGVIMAIRTWGIKPFPVAGFGWDSRLVLPALVLAARPIAQISRITAVTLSDIGEEDYVRTAHAKGLPALWIRFRHIYPHLAIPVLTTVVSSFRFSLSSLPVVELFFAWPGAGFSLLRAIARADDALTVGLAASLGLVFILVNSLVHASYGRFDPRVGSAPRTRTSARQAKRPLTQVVREIWEDIQLGIGDSRLIRWLKGHSLGDTADEKTREAIRSAASRFRVASRSPGGKTGRSFSSARVLVRTIGKIPPLLVGFPLLILLLCIVVMGPAWSPHNPYQHNLLQMVDGRLSSAPYPPSETYPWGTDVLGRDILSLVLTGAGRTLSLALQVVLARLLAGFVLGVLAGWRAGGALDRAVVGLSEILSAFPTLLLAMLLILGIGIHRGPVVFVIALAVVGWGEVMHFVRGQVIAIRPQTYIESAVAIGLRPPGIVLSHVLPNVLSPLIALGALEMGATLMLLGELGFVGIFIGGGALAELFPDLPRFHYSDVPEWGALLSNMRLYARAHPWTAFYPSMAFFISIMAFNLFGEGLRVLIQRVGFSFTRLLNRYTLAFTLVVFLALLWARDNIGPWQFYRQEARGFHAERALQDIHFLSDVSLAGRRVGTEGIEVAADYIAGQFKAAGLNAGGEEMGYFKTMKRDFAVFEDVPALQLDYPDGRRVSLEYGREFSPFHSLHYMHGEGEGEIVFVAAPPSAARKDNRGRYPAWERADLGDAFLLLLPRTYQEDPRGYDLRISAGRGVLTIAERADELERYELPSAHLQGYREEQALELAGKPVFSLSPATAEGILSESGYSLAALTRQARSLGEEELLIIRTGVIARGAVRSERQQQITARAILGTYPGMNPAYDAQMILVLAPYDGLGVGPDGTLYPGANTNSSPVAIMLEIIRSWRESQYMPNKTFMFVAYPAGGFPSGQEPRKTFDPLDFVETRYAYKDAFQLDTVIHLGALGGGDGRGLEVSVGGHQRLGQLLCRSARSMGVRCVQKEDELDTSLLFEAGSTGPGSGRGFSGPGQRAPAARLNWEGSDTSVGTAYDVVDKIDLELVEQAGRVISMALMTLGREMNY